MDVARSSIRLGAESVDVVYRRRKVDMTALPEEVEGAEAEGCNIVELMTPVSIEKNEDGTVKGIWLKPQMTSIIESKRPSPKDKNTEKVFLPCDIIVASVGQGIDSKHFEDKGIQVKKVL